MENRFNTYINGLDVDFWRRLCVERGEPRHYAKGEAFAVVGSVAPYVGYIERGTLKYLCYSTDGTEHVVGLEYTGEFVADFPFSLRGRPARVSIIADSPRDIHCVPVKTIVSLMESDPRVEELVLRSTEVLFNTVYERYFDNISKTPLERYTYLIDNNPEIFNLFSLKDIASYLNITPTHLSRLRRKA